MHSIKNYSLKELEEIFVSIGEKPFRAKQVFSWLFRKNALSFDDMTNISVELRKKLKEKFKISDPAIQKVLTTNDNTVKFLTTLSDNKTIESVIIPNLKRTTLCISTQIGCKMGCKFCATAKMGFIRNLTMQEILDQIISANRLLFGKKKITHLVFMGMGEPLNNFDNLIKSLDVINSDYGFCISPKRVTISTSGISGKIEELIKISKGEKLAVSLNAPLDEKREKLMPGACKNMNIEKLLLVAKMYAIKTKTKVTFEYVLIKDFNDSIEDAKILKKRLKDIPAKLNIIPFNKTIDLEFFPPDEEVINLFIKEMQNSSVIITVRRSRGAEIGAACGQLCINLNKANLS